MKKDISIYIHIPFCVKKCAYCDFLSAPACDTTIEKYVDRLCEELRRYGEKYYDRRVITVFFGGGTPSLLSAAQITRIAETLKSSFDIDEQAEISIECNPGTVSYEKLTTYKHIGINRLSIGLQSANDNELRLLGRIHTYEQFLQTYNSAKDAGFDNINVDIMSALPGQTIESYLATLKAVVDLQPKHISAYSLIIEDGTPFGKIYADMSLDTDSDTQTHKAEDRTIVGAIEYPPLPDEDSERQMYYLTEKLLSEHGYHRYEISNYAYEEYECKHNLVYWTGGDYIGVGLGASSYVDGVRYKVTDNLDAYLKEQCVYGDGATANVGCAGFKYEDIMPISVEDKMEEYMITGLRLMRGVSKSKWRSIFENDMSVIYSDVIEKYERLGLLETVEEKKDVFVRLTRHGIDVSNTVMADFLLDKTDE